MSCRQQPPPHPAPPSPSKKLTPVSENLSSASIHPPFLETSQNNQAPATDSNLHRPPPLIRTASCQLSLSTAGGHVATHQSHLLGDPQELEMGPVHAALLRFFCLPGLPQGPQLWELPITLGPSGSQPSSPKHTGDSVSPTSSTYIHFSSLSCLVFT